MDNPFNITNTQNPGAAATTPASLLTTQDLKDNTTKINPFNITNKVTQTPPPETTALGQAKNFAFALPSAIVQTGAGVAGFLKDVALAFPRSLAKVAQTTGQAVNQFTGNQFNDQAFTIQKPEKWWQDPIGTLLAGNDKQIQPLANTVEDLNAQIKNSPFAQKIGVDKFSLPLATAGVVLSTELDLAPFGGEKNFVEALAKETNPLKVTQLLIKSGINKQIAERVAPEIAQITEPVMVADAMRVIKSMQSSFLAQAAEKTATVAGNKAFADNYVVQNTKQPIVDYFKQIQSHYGTTNIISTDDAKAVIPGYNGTNSDAYQSAAGQITQQAYDLLLKNNKGVGNDTVLVMAGGTGAGKTTALKNAGVKLADYSIVYDTNLASLASAQEKIDKALLKIDNGTYGTDDEGKEISQERLAALPWADKAI